jgi:hypothetical protein
MSETGQQRMTVSYQSGRASIDDLQTELSEALTELATPGSELAVAAVALGAVPQDLTEAQGTISQQGKGFGAVIVLFTILAPVENHILRNIWDDLIWPRIKARLGADALGQKQPSGDSADSNN